MVHWEETQSMSYHVVGSQCVKIQSYYIGAAISHRRRHNWAIFLRKWARRGCYSQWRSTSGHVERIFIHKNWRGGYWQHLASTEGCYVTHNRSYTRCFARCFWRSHYQPQSWCRLATSELRFDTVGPLETIDALKDNIREVAIDNVLKNWTDRVGYCMANRGSHLN